MLAAEAPPCPLPTTCAAPPGACATSFRPWPRLAPGCAAAPTARPSTSTPTCASPPTATRGFRATPAASIATCAAAPATWPACCWRTCPCPLIPGSTTAAGSSTPSATASSYFGESLAATGDRFAMLGFSSRRRDPVRVHQPQGLQRALWRGDPRPHPGHQAWLLHPPRAPASVTPPSAWSREPAGRRLLLILTDGKPNDLDRYEGRWGIEDTRHAVGEAPPPGPGALLRHHRSRRATTTSPTSSAAAAMWSSATPPSCPPACPCSMPA
jgi:hypothetical protein